MIEIAILLAAPLAAYFLTGLVRQYALASKLLDLPNERSSHGVTTPRGGGLAIVWVVLGTLPILWCMETQISGKAIVALGIGGVAVASIGWWDDRSNLPARWRFLIHISSAVLVVVVAGTPPSLQLPGLEWGWGVFGSVVLVIFIAWMLNLYNFMDGIDGLAAVEAVTVCGIGAILLMGVGESDWALFSAVMALASAGFLAWNWPPARIFLGDTGSGFLGFMLASVSVLTWVESTITLWPWLILLGVFIVDASLTVTRRALRGDRVHQAHRNHAYQHAARRYGTHLPVTVAVLLINLLWLAPWAVAATVWPSWGAAFVAAAWAPLLLVGLLFRAGIPE